MRDLRIREAMTKEEIEQFGADNPHRIEYAYGSTTDYDTPAPILLRSLDFWMPLGRAKRIHQWLGRAISECEQRRKPNDKKAKVRNQRVS